MLEHRVRLENSSCRLELHVATAFVGEHADPLPHPRKLITADYKTMAIIVSVL